MDDLTVKTDEELARLSRGDEAAFGALVGRYGERLARYLRRLGVSSAEDQEDLLQEIFLAAYENINGFDASLRFSSWVYRIAHNEAMDFFRRRRARPAVDLADEDLARFASNLDIRREAEAKDDAERIRAAVDGLPQEYRDVLVLKYFEYQSYDEISDVLKIPPGTVATRLNRAKERLKDALTRNGYAYGER